MPRWSWFQAAHPAKRIVALVILLAVAIVLVGLVARLVDFAPGFNHAQSSSAEELVRHPDRWQDWRDTGRRDLLIFIPAYVAVGVGAIAWASWRRPPSTFAFAFMVTGGAFDVVETMLFRTSLGRLLSGGTKSDVTTLTGITGVATKAKIGCLLVAAVLLAAGVLRSPDPNG